MEVTGFRLGEQPKSVNKTPSDALNMSIEAKRTHRKERLFRTPFYQRSGTKSPQASPVDHPHLIAPNYSVLVGARK